MTLEVPSNYGSMILRLNKVQSLKLYMMNVMKKFLKVIMEKLSVVALFCDGNVMPPSISCCLGKLRGRTA